MKRSQFLGSMLAALAAVPLSRRARAAWLVGDGDPSRERRDLATSRDIQIRRVEAYAAAGRFPRNLDFEGQRVPYFIDDRGIPCAVAHLMIESGLGAQVREIARTNNHVVVSAVKEGPVVTWVLRSGLLQEEAALIQPSYGWEDRPHPVRPRPTPIPEDLGIVQERERVRLHLRNTVATLRANTDASLATALTRLPRG